MLTRRRFLRSLPCAGLGVVAFAAVPEIPRRRPGTTFIKAVRKSGYGSVGLEHLDGEIVEVVRPRMFPGSVTYIGRPYKIVRSFEFAKGVA